MVLQPGALPVHGCESCGGLWLGPDASVQILRGLDEPVDHAIAQRSDTLALRSFKSPEVPEGERVCPYCDQPLARVDVHTVRIESCFTHGSWFDRSEVHEVILTCAKLHVQQREEALYSGFGVGVLWETLVRVLTDRT